RGQDEPLAARPGKSITAVAFHPDGAYLAVGYDDGIVTVHDLQHNNQEVLRFGHGTPIIRLGFSPDRRGLAVLFQSETQRTSAVGRIRLWVTEKLWATGKM